MKEKFTEKGTLVDIKLRELVIQTDRAKRRHHFTSVKAHLSGKVGLENGFAIDRLLVFEAWERLQKEQLIDLHSVLFQQIFTILLFFLFLSTFLCLLCFFLLLFLLSLFLLLAFSVRGKKGQARENYQFFIPKSRLDVPFETHSSSLFGFFI